MKSYQSPPTARAGSLRLEIINPGMYGEVLGSNACNCTSLLRVAIKGGTSYALILKTLRIVDGDGNVITECLQEPQLFAWKCTQIRVRSDEHTNQLTVDFPWNCPFTSRIVFLFG
jgi:hypothetical protein